MYCVSCGRQLPEGTNFCPACGRMTGPAYPEMPRTLNLRGFSSRISDPYFAKYVKRSNRWSALFSVILAAGALLGFYIAGERGAGGLKNPEALTIGLVIGGMFLLIALFQIVGRKRSKTWNGTVEDKKVKRKSHRRDIGDGRSEAVTYLEYTVFIRSDEGKRRALVTQDSDALYNYFQIGDRVRHHAGLNAYEKYDKTGDKIIPCVVCRAICDINTDICFRCKSPLLK